MSTPPNIHIAFADFAPDFNQVIMDGFLRCHDEPLTRKSHYFGNRHENIYITSAQMPMLELLVDTAIRHAQDALGKPAEPLRCGYWFNAMLPGHITQMHSHDDADERLSGVYYVQVPPRSGQLLLKQGDEITHITPQAGMFVFFPADIEHAVSEHRGEGLRLSIGMNFGPA